MVTVMAAHAYGPPGGWSGGGPGPWMLMGPIWLLFWFLVVAAIVMFAIRARRRGWGRPGPGGPFGGRGGFWGPGGPGQHPWGPPPPTGPDGEPVAPPELALERARAILHERYAKGEISTEEYRERIDNLV